MASSPLTNYLRANRKRLALSQEDVANLLGSESGELVCRHERFVREPSLETVLAYEAIYQRPASELFAGLYKKVQKKVAARAKALAKAPNRRRVNRQAEYRIQVLSGIVGRLSEDSPAL